MTSREAFVKAASICARQEKCISEINKKLKDWGVDEIDISKTIDQLIAEKFIDEERYVRFYVKDKFVFNRWGKIKIRYQLKHKGIFGTVVDESLNEIDADEYKNTLVQLLINKKKLIRHDDDYKIKNSLLRFASSRGFEPDIIYSALDELVDY